MCFEVCAMLEAVVENIRKTIFLAFQKSVNNGRSSKFSLASKQDKKRFETHLFPSLAIIKLKLNLAWTRSLQELCHLDWDYESKHAKLAWWNQEYTF